MWAQHGRGMGANHNPPKKGQQKIRQISKQKRQNVQVMLLNEMVLPQSLDYVHGGVYDLQPFEPTVKPTKLESTKLAPTKL